MELDGLMRNCGLYSLKPNPLMVWLCRRKNSGDAMCRGSKIMGLTSQQARRAFRVRAGRRAAQADARNGWPKLKSACAASARKRAQAKAQRRLCEWFDLGWSCSRCGIDMRHVLDPRECRVYCGNCGEELQVRIAPWCGTINAGATFGG